MFKEIRLKGVMKDWFDPDPVFHGNIHVSALDAHSSRENTVGIFEFETESDGSFDKSFKAAKSGEYFIHFGTDRLTASGTFVRLKIKEGETHDFGEVVFSHNFVCRVNIKYTSGKDQRIYFGSEPFATSFPPNTNTVFFETKAMSKEEFEENNHTYNLFYTYFGPSIAEYHSIKIPIGKSDTVSANVEY